MKSRSSMSTAATGRAPWLLDAEVVRLPAGAARQVAVSGGLCVPRGKLQDVGALRVTGAGWQTIAQADVLDRWSDGSIRWLLASFVIPEIPDAAPSQMLVTSSENSTGAAGYTSTRRLALQLEPLAGAEQADRELLAQQQLMIVRHRDGEVQITRRQFCEATPDEFTVRLRPVLTGTDGNVRALTIDQVREETHGAVRQVVVINARLQAHPCVSLQLRLTHWAQTGLLQVETRLRNSRRAQHKGGLWDLGDAGSFLFLGLEIRLECSEVGRTAATRWRAESDLPLRQVEPGRSVSIQQLGSGGRWWNSRNHVTADGTCPVRERGYEVRSGSDVYRGYRAEPVLAVVESNAFLAVSVPEFWQQFPGSLSGAAGQIGVGLFPATAGAPYELQGGEQKTRTIWVASGAGQPDPAGLSWTLQPPCLLQAPEVYQQARVFQWFPGRLPSDAETAVHPGSALSHGNPAARSGLRQHDDSRRLARYLSDATSGSASLAARREAMDEYGWRNFGDLPADHEQTHYAGSETIISHYNNQFDLIFGGIQQLAASGDPRWIDLFDPLARHVMDIDIYHTAEDRAVFNGGLFWHTDHYVDAHTASHRTYSAHNRQPGQPYGGGPGCEHNYTTGLLYYYLLTGHPEARQSVLSLAEWVIRMDDGRNTVLSLLDDGPTGFASATVYADFHGPGRGAGNSINALLDAWLLTRSVRFLDKAEELIRRCVHPRQDLDALQLTAAESHWSYTVFLTVLSRYLLIKLEAGQQDTMYAYARDVMSHYGRWMVRHERPTLSRPDELQYPTEAWAAQDFRKANVLALAAACEAEPRHAAAMRSRSRELNNAAWDDLYAFGQAHRTARCLSILMTEGLRDVFHRCCPPEVIPPAAVAWSAPEWEMFVPQKVRVRRLLRSPLQALWALLGALRPQRIRQAVQALRRQLGARW